MASSSRLCHGHDAAGKSVSFSSDDARNAHVGSGGTRVTELWETVPHPPTTRAISMLPIARSVCRPPANGSIFRIVEYPPDSERNAVLRGTRLTTTRVPATPATSQTPVIPASTKHRRSITPSSSTARSTPHGRREELMRAGDVLVQRGTNHAWSNRTNETVHIASS